MLKRDREVDNEKHREREGNPSKGNKEQAGRTDQWFWAEFGRAFSFCQIHQNAHCGGHGRLHSEYSCLGEFGVSKTLKLLFGGSAADSTFVPW